MPTATVRLERREPSRKLASTVQSAGSATRLPRSARWGTLAPAILSSLLSWASFPPVDWWPLAWIAPVGWLWLCQQSTLPGRRPWLVLWLSGFAFWLGVLHFLRLPHPATSIGWFALSFYFAFYTPAFVWLTRRAVHIWRLPLALAAPVVWTGLELLRGHLFTGLTIASLGHTQQHSLRLLQAADLAGAYGLSFLVMLVAAALATCVPGATCRRTRYLSLVMAAAALLATLGYGEWRLTHLGHVRTGPKVALIQGSIDTVFDFDPDHRKRMYEQYRGLSEQAVREHTDLDLIIWPETMFRDPIITFTDDIQPPADADWTIDDARAAAERNRDFVEALARSLNVHLILGVDRHQLGRREVEHFNEALYVDRDGRQLGYYDKMHPVMFGEYIPFGNLFPILYQLTPLTAGLSPGRAPASFEVGDTRLSPSICFENFLPHLIRRQIRTLRQCGAEPDVLVTLTNDGWFWGSSELDLHLTCGVFRAVEFRKPVLIAANTGFSASIDSSGRVLAQGPRRATGVVVDRVSLDDRTSLYDGWGDLPAGLCLAFCVALTVPVLVQRVIRSLPRLLTVTARHSTGE